MRRLSMGNVSNRQIKLLRKKSIANMQFIKSGLSLESIEKFRKSINQAR